MADPISVGVIGAGRIGRIHAHNLAFEVPRAALALIADVRADAANEAAARSNGAGTVTDYCEILDDAGIAAIVIASPTDTHARLIEEAAAAGKHIFCEKPVALDLDATQRAIDAARAAGVILQLGFNRRFDVNFQRIARAVREGRIGKPELVRITSRDPEPPSIDYVRSSGGLFLDMTIHDLDMARFVVGDEVTEVYAVGAALVDPAIETAGDIDTAAVTLRFRCGTLCTIDNSRRAAYGYDQRVEVLGSTGCVSTANRTESEVAVWDADGEHRSRPLAFFLERYRESYLEEMRAFVGCIREGREPPVTGEDGLEALRLALAAARSLRETRPVRLDEGVRV